MNIIFVDNKQVKFLPVKDKNKQDPFSLFQYQDKVFERLNISFSQDKKQMLEQYCNVLQEQKKNVLVLNKKIEYLVYIEVEKKITSIATEEESNDIQLEEEQVLKQEESILEEEIYEEIKPPYLTLASVLIMQNMLEEIEYLMGQKQQLKFKKDLRQLLKKLSFPEMKSLDQINDIIDINALDNQNLPIWSEVEIQRLFPVLRDLGRKYFGNTFFVDVCIQNLQSLSVYNEPEFMNCCMQFVMISKI